MKWHPDKVTDEALKEIATRKFQVISRCYEVLSDKDKRAVYDQTGNFLSYIVFLKVSL